METILRVAWAEGGVGPRVNTLLCKPGVCTGVLILDLKKAPNYTFFNDGNDLTTMKLVWARFLALKTIVSYLHY